MSSTNLTVTSDLIPSNQTDSSKTHSHPKVEAANNFVTMDLRNNIDYTGPIYVGSEFRENHLVYDTMSEWTVILGENARGN